MSILKKLSRREKARTFAQQMAFQASRTNELVRFAKQLVAANELAYGSKYHRLLCRAAVRNVFDTTRGAQNAYRVV